MDVAFFALSLQLSLRLFTLEDQTVTELKVSFFCLSIARLFPPKEIQFPWKSILGGSMDRGGGSALCLCH